MSENATINTSENAEATVDNVEEIEIEIDEEDIVGYLVDEDDNEIGLIYKDENGNEKELYYDGSSADELEVVEVACVDGGGGITASVADEAGATDNTTATDGSAQFDTDVETEVIEIPENVAYYMVTPDGTEIGFVTIDDNGEKQEFEYPESAQSTFFLLAEAQDALNRATSAKGAAGNLVSTGANAVGGVVNKVAGKQVVNTEKISNAVGATANKTKKPAKSSAGADDDAVTTDDLKDMFGTFKDVAIEGYAALSGVLDKVDDVRDQIDDINPKKHRERRRAERAAQKAEEARKKRVAQKAELDAKVAEGDKEKVGETSSAKQDESEQVKVDQSRVIDNKADLDMQVVKVNSESESATPQTQSADNNNTDPA